MVRAGTRGPMKAALDTFLAERYKLAYHLRYLLPEDDLDYNDERDTPAFELQDMLAWANIQLVETEAFALPGSCSFCDYDWITEVKHRGGSVPPNLDCCATAGYSLSR